MRSSPQPLRRAVAAIAALGALAGSAQAAVTSYTNSAAFDAATATWERSVLDFEGAPAGILYEGSTLQAASGIGIALSGPSQGWNWLVVADQYWTTSGANYLALDNFDTAVLQGDRLTFTLERPTHAFGLWVIGTADVQAGDIVLQANGVSVGNAAQYQRTDYNGSYAWFLGLVSDHALTEVTLSNLDPSTERYLGIAVDDVVSAVSPVPEPDGAALLLAGAAVIAAARHRARRAGQSSSPKE